MEHVRVFPWPWNLLSPYFGWTCVLTIKSTWKVSLFLQGLLLEELVNLSGVDN